MIGKTIGRDKSILLLFSPFFLSGNSFYMLIILFKVSILNVASYLTVTSWYTYLYTSTAYTHYGQLYIARLIMN